MNEREKRFCQEYMIDLCAKRAALRAGYAPHTARYAAWAWIHPEHPTKPEVRAEIDRMLADRAERVRASADRVVAELTEIAYEGKNDARVADRLRALEILGKHLGMFRGERADAGAPVILDDVGEAAPDGEN